MPTRAERQRALSRGTWAERVAAWLLRAKGYRIVAARVRTPVGEIDLIARRGRTTAFVEVKARASQTRAMEAITPRQAKRQVAAARWWLAAQPPSQTQGHWRFDIVLVSPYLLPRHLPNAFSADP